MIPGLKAIIFDVDGTLAETEEQHRLAFNAAFAEAGLDWCWDRRLYAELLTVTGGKERIRRFIDGKPPADRADLSARTTSLHARKTELYTSAVRAGEIDLRPGVRALIAAAEARGIALAIATTTTRENVEALITTCLGPAAIDRFKAVVCGEDTLHKKPAPDVYLEALRRLGLSPHESVAIEDSRNGVLSARAAGLKVIVTPSLYASQDDFTGATAIFGDATSIAGWLGWVI